MFRRIKMTMFCEARKADKKQFKFGCIRGRSAFDPALFSFGKPFKVAFMTPRGKCREEE